MRLHLREVPGKPGWRPGMATRISGLPEGLHATFAPAPEAAGPDPVWHLAFARDAAALTRIAAEAAQPSPPHALSRAT